VKKLHSVSVLGGKRAHGLVLLLEGLEAAVADLGGGIDELNLDLLGHPLADSGEDRLADNDGALSDTANTTLDEQEVLVDLTIVGKPPMGVMFFSMASLAVMALFFTPRQAPAPTR